ncbi:hypothetical protein FS842_001252 [Serendipita sp. 407]|nr:hypothetical protein FS842_001252 [Serendipita sp. 407]
MSVIMSRAESVACGICKKAVAKYSCPECNVPYCSLECYRGEGHRVCSEGFYKSIIEEEIHSAPERLIEEKKAMIIILQRMADTNAFSIDNGIVSNEDEESRMESKLETLGLCKFCPLLEYDIERAGTAMLLYAFPSTKVHSRPKQCTCTPASRHDTELQIYSILRSRSR